MSESRPSARRGFATSASFLIVFVGLLIAVGSLYTAVANSAERLGEAREDDRDRQDAVRETAVNVTGATWDNATTTLTIRVANTGDRTLSVADVDSLVDGTYVGVTAYERTEVAGHDSDVWRPGEVLLLEDENTVAGFESAPSRVKVVTGAGVAAVREVEYT